MIPYDRHTYIGVTVGSHAVIYSTSARIQLLENQNEIYKCDYDLYLNSYFNYIYYTPVIYQLFPDTENQQSWGEFSIYIKIPGYIQVNPGYDLFNFISKFIWIFILILI